MVAADGVVKSPPYFCAPVGDEHAMGGNERVIGWPEKVYKLGLKYFSDVYYVIQFIQTESESELRHFANAMQGVHDVSPPDEDDDNDSL